MHNNSELNFTEMKKNLNYGVVSNFPSDSEIKLLSPMENSDARQLQHRTRSRLLSCIIETDSADSCDSKEFIDKTDQVLNSFKNYAVDINNSELIDTLDEEKLDEIEGLEKNEQKNNFYTACVYAPVYKPSRSSALVKNRDSLIIQSDPYFNDNLFSNEMVQSCYGKTFGPNLSRNDEQDFDQIEISTINNIYDANNIPLDINNCNIQTLESFIGTNTDEERNDNICPSCRQVFDNQKKRRLIDACGHERCYTCLFHEENCPICEAIKNYDKNTSNDYDTGIDGSSSTIVSPFGSPQPQLKFQHFNESSKEILPLDCNAEDSMKDSKPNLSSSTPQPKRKLFTSKGIKSTFENHGHRRTTSNGNMKFLQASDSGDNNLLETSTCSDSVVTRRRKYLISNKLTGGGSNRLSLIGTNAGNLSSFVFGKIKSLWNAQSHSINAGLNQLADDKDEFMQGKLKFISDEMTNSTATKSSKSSSEICSNEPKNDECESNDKSCKNKSFFRVNEAVSDENLDASTSKKIIGLRCGYKLKAQEDKNLNSSIPNHSALNLKPLFFEVPQEIDPAFTGRQWLFRELSNLLGSDSSSQGVLILGRSGTGKTSIILQLVEYSCFGRGKNLFSTETDGVYCQINVGQERIKSLASNVVAYHFCQIENNITCLVPEFIHSIAAQLCQAPQLLSYREYLENEPGLKNILTIKECIADPDRVMLTAIIEPLIYLKKINKITTKMCIFLIDGLCEAEYHRPDHSYTIGSFIVKMTRYLPPWLKIICTCRTELKEYIHGLPYSQLVLDSLDANDNIHKDILDYILYRINQNSDIQNNIGYCKENSIGQYKFINYLITLTKGSFLFCKLLMDLIEKSHIVVKSSSYKILPVSLAQIYLLNMNLKFPTNARYEKISPILNVCLAALYPLTAKEIYYSICSLSTKDHLTLSEFTECFQSLNGFIVKRLDDTYMFFHPSFREWLLRRDDGESTKFLSDYRMGHAAISFHLSRNPPLNEEKTLELCHHILKAHLFRNHQTHLSARDLSAFWVNTASEKLSQALGSLRNIYSPNLKVSRLLLLSGASPDFCTEFLGSAPILCVAAYEGILPMVSLLLEFGANVSLTNSQRCTALHLAAMKGHCDVIRLLVAGGSKVSQADITSRCALIHAARMGHNNVVKYLLAVDWGFPNEANEVSLKIAVSQSFIAACLQGYISIVEDLIDSDYINLNDEDSLTGETGLTAACKNGCLELVELLLARGAQIDLLNKNGCTPLITAIKEGNLSIVEILLQNSVDLEKTESAGNKIPLQIAASMGDLQILKILIEYGANLERQDVDGLTALSWACLRGRLDIVHYLISCGSNTEHEDNNGRSVLDLAVYQGSVALVELLLEYGLKLDHTDRSGMRPLDRAIACRNISVIQLILKKGTKLGPATWAMAYGKADIFVILINKLLEDGNVLYRKNRFKDAAHRYEYALAKLSKKNLKFDKHTVFNQLKVNLLLNLSRSKRKTNEISQAIEIATQAIEIAPDRYEGYYARAKSNYDRNYINEALADAKKSVEHSKKAPIDVNNILQRFLNEVLSKSLEDNLKIDSYEITDL